MWPNSFRTFFRLTVTIFVATLVAYHPALTADTVRLFYNLGVASVPVRGYEREVLQLEGKSVIFSNGQTLRIGKLLGSGGTTVVYALADDPGKVVRLALDRQAMFPLNFLKSTWNGYKVFAAYDLPIVKLYESSPGEYVTAERIASYVTFDNFIRELNGELLNGRNVVDSRLVIKMENALVRFAKKAAKFNLVGDFRPEQLVYDELGDRWVLLDWTNRHLFSVRASKGVWGASGHTVMDSLFAGTHRLRIERLGKTVKCIPCGNILPAVISACEKSLQTAEKAREEWIEQLNQKISKKPRENCIGFFLRLSFFGR